MSAQVHEKEKKKKFVSHTFGKTLCFLKNIYCVFGYSPANFLIFCFLTTKMLQDSPHRATLQK